MAWTITQTVDKVAVLKVPTDYETIRIKLDCASDASGTDTDLSTAVMAAVKDSFLWAVVCVPGAGGSAPAAAFRLQIQDENDVDLLDTGAGQVSATAQTSISGSLGWGIIPPVFGTCSFVCGTLGDTKTAVFYLYFLKGM